MDLFLYDNGLRHERVKRLLKSSEEKSYFFVNDTKLIILMKTIIETVFFLTTIFQCINRSHCIAL